MFSSSQPTPVRLTIERGEDEIGYLVGRECLSDILRRTGLEANGGFLRPEEETPPVEVGRPAPSFEGQELYAGNVINNRTFRDRFVLLVFWTSWCAGCAEMKPTLQQLLARNTGGLVVVGVNLDDRVDPTPGTPRGAPFAHYQIRGGGWFGEMSRRWHVYHHGVPWSVLIDPRGNVQAQGRPRALAATALRPEVLQHRPVP